MKGKFPQVKVTCVLLKLATSIATVVCYLYLHSLLTHHSFLLLYCTQGGIDSRESITTVRKKIKKMKEQLPTMTEMLERVDVEEDLEKTDGVIENLVAEVWNNFLA